MMTPWPDGSKRGARVVAVVVAIAMVTSAIAVPALATDRTEERASAGDRASNEVGAGGDSTSTAEIGRTLEARLTDADRDDTVRAVILLADQPDVETARADASSRTELVRALRERVEGSQEPVLRRIESLQATGDVSSVRRHWLVNAVSVEATSDAIDELARVDGVSAVVADVEMQVSSEPVAGPAANASGGTNESGPVTGDNVTITTGAEIDRSASAPRALNASDAVGLPESYAAPDDVGDLDPERAAAPEPITGESTGDVPSEASAPFDGDDLAWGVEKVHADAATGAGYDGSNVTVAVIDTGIDDDHPDLDDRVVGWKDFVNGFEDPYDDAGHGTHVAGTVAGTGDAGVRTGVAPGANLVGVKVLGGGGSGLLSNVLAGMEWSIRNDADVLSLSLGGPHDPLFHAAVDRAVEAGVVPIVAAGNIGGSRDPFAVDVPNLLAVTDPGHARSAVTVGATHWQDRVAWFSARETLGEEGDRYVKPDVVAPGQNVTSARAEAGDYARLSGTSMATPHVSGIAALILQADPSAGPDEVRELLAETATDLGEPGPDDVYGAGRVDARAALAAAGQETDLAVDVSTNTSDGLSRVTAVATLTDASGAPVAGENVRLHAVYGPRSSLERHEANPDLYAYDGTGTTGENGTVTFRFSRPSNATPSGTYTVAAEASGGLARNATEVGLDDDLDVSVTPRFDDVRHNGDTLFFDVEARDADGDPANVTVNAILHGPTNGRLPGWTRTVTTGPNGSATMSVRVSEDVLELYRGVRPGGSVPSYGRYGVTTVVRDGNGTMRDFDVHAGIAEVEPRWTDLELSGGETPLTSVQDVETWLGEVTIGERVNGTLATTDPNETYRIVVAQFDATTRPDEPSIRSVAKIATVTTGEDGSATFDATVPASLPGGYYAILAVREGRDVTEPGPVGTFDAGYTYVRALETDIRIDSREDATNQAFQPGEAVRITAVTRNASSGERVDPRDLSLRLAGFTDVTAARHTGAGTVQVNARFADVGSPTGVVAASGLDQNGGAFVNHTETATARPFSVHVEPDASSYEPGENATLEVRVSDSETGAAVEGAEIRAVVTGAANLGNWRVNETVRTDEDGAATITVPVPPDAVGIEYLTSDAIVTLTSIEKGSRLGTAVTGFDLDQGEGPSISVSQNGSESLGLFGVNDVATYEPGERITFEVDATGFDPSVANWSERSADVLVAKYSKVGDGTFVFDANESETAVVRLDDEGRATYEYELADDAESGLVVPTVSTQVNGVTLTDSQLGMVGASPVNVTTNLSSVGQGERIAFEVGGDLPDRADVDFVVKRKGSEGQFPLASVDGASAPDLAPVLADRNRTLERTEPLAAAVVDRLPERFGNRDAIRRALQEALVPAMSQSLAASATDGAHSVRTGPATPGDEPARVGQTFVVPENLPPGTYRVIAIVHSDDGGSVKERIGFAEFEVED